MANAVRKVQPNRAGLAPMQREQLPSRIDDWWVWRSGASDEAKSQAGL